MKLALALVLTLVVSQSNHELQARPSTLRQPQGRPEQSRGATGSGRAEEQATARVITIDAIVRDVRGRTVDTLKSTDFELREDGAVRTLDEARFVRDEPRTFAIYLDDFHVEGGDASARVRDALLAFLDRSVAPSDRLVVLKPLDSILRIQPVADRAAARRIVEAFEGRKGDYTARTDYERELIAGSPPRVEAARAQVVWSGIEALAVHLGSYAGRKSLILATEPFAVPVRRRGQEMLSSLDSAIRAANRWNVSVYPVDPGETPAKDEPPLGRLAADTDGRVIAGELDEGLRRLDDDARGYYLLTYRSDHPDDGRFHDVQIRLPRASKNEVRARKGFYDVSPDEAIGKAMIARMNAPKPTTPPEPPAHASMFIRPWFGWSRGDDGHTRVTFVWEPAMPVPGERRPRIAAHLVLTALTPTGTVIFEGPVAPTGAGAIDEPGATQSRISFEVPPGRVKLRMAITDAAGQPIDRDVREIVVRDLKGPVVIGTPEVLRARNARELRTLESEASVPVVSREFSRAEELLLRVPVYAGDARPDVSARLLGRSGQAMRQLDAVGSVAPGGVDTFTLPLAGLAVGEYTIEVTAKTTGGEAIDRLTFRVVS